LHQRHLTLSRDYR